jgi:hypothetical protein
MAENRFPTCFRLIPWGRLSGSTCSVVAVGRSRITSHDVSHHEKLQVSHPQFEAGVFQGRQASQHSLSPIRVNLVLTSLIMTFRIPPKFQIASSSGETRMGCLSYQHSLSPLYLNVIMTSFDTFMTSGIPPTL